MSMNFGVLGAGSWGTSIAHLLGEQEEVYLWGRNKQLIEQIQVNRENNQYLRGISLPYNVRATYELDHVLKDSDVLVVAVPSQAFVKVLDRVHHALDNVYAFVNLTKGFHPSSGRLLSREFLQVRETLEDYYVLTGPSHAREVAENNPTSVVIGGGQEGGRIRLQEIFHRDYFRVYRNDDLIGLEMASALKNVIAIAAGISDGLEFGANARATLITRGLQEIRRMAEHEGAEGETVFGLTGVGDLVATCTTSQSRNYRLGKLLAEGYSVGEAREEIEETVEGIEVTRIARERVLKAEIRAPIITEVYAVLYEKLDPVTAVENLTTRRPRPEFPGNGD